MTNQLKAGFLQFQPLLGEQENNIERLSLLLNQAKGADLIVIPELANSGYNFENKEQAFELSEEIEKSIYVDFLEAEAAKHNLFIVSGINEREGGKLLQLLCFSWPCWIYWEISKDSSFYE